MGTHSCPAIPVVEDGRIEFIEVETGPGCWHFIEVFFSDDAPAWCNRALEANGLRAVFARLTNGSKVIQTEPAGHTL